MALVWIVLAAIVVSGCVPTPPTAPTTSGTRSATSTASPVAATGPASAAEPPPTEPAEAGAELRLEPIVEGLDQPVAVAGPDDGSGDLYIVEQAGRILRLPGGHGPAEVALDIRGHVGSGGERGLLGLAFHPAVAENDRLFVDYTDDQGDTIIAELRLEDRRIDPDRERRVLKVSQPAANHNGGDLHFGPDGMLYVALGDGGGGNSGNGRRLDTLLGKILRLDVTGPPEPGLGYAVPVDNPFVGREGVRPEIWATGLRNPWRFFIEPGSGALWIGDVGAGEREEIDFAPTGGLDFGWDAVEGTVCRDQAACQDETLIAPVAEYGHDQGCVVTGGPVYTGTAIEALAGRYVFADYCTGRISTLDALLGYGSVQTPEPLLETGRRIVAFGQDPDGEVLVVDHDGSVLRLTAAP